MNSFCTNCGKKITSEQDVCLNCGKSIKNKKNIETDNEIQEYNSFALTGFFLGLLSMFCVNAYGVVGFFALVFSIIGLIKIKKDHTLGKGLAITGIILGSIGIFAVIVMLMI